MSERDQDTGHDYDGIREFDNPLPRWWLLTLYGAMGFAVVYWMYYHTLDTHAGLRDEYEMAMKRADEAEDAREAQLMAQGKIGDEQFQAMAKDAETVARGQIVFQQNCVACHGDRGQGIIGPNLTDEYWLHGDRPMDLYKTISGGVLDKGMPSWKPLLGSRKVKDVLAFVLSIRNTHVPGKPPQGVSWNGQRAGQP